MPRRGNLKFFKGKAGLGGVVVNQSDHQAKSGKAGAPGSGRTHHGHLHLRVDHRQCRHGQGAPGQGFARYHSPHKAWAFIALNCSTTSKAWHRRAEAPRVAGEAPRVAGTGLGRNAFAGQDRRRALSCQDKMLQVLEESALTRVCGTRHLALEQKA